MDDHYELLGLEREATAAHIRAAYLRLCTTTHPDRGGSPEAFDALKKAYAVLSDDDRRAVYDERLPPASVVRPKAEPVSQIGVVKGVHARVHGQTGLTLDEREAELQKRIAKAQAEQETATDEEWRRRDTQEAIDAQASGDAAFHSGEIEAAVQHYTAAVRLVAAQWDESLPLDVAALYSSRAEAFARLGKHTRALADAEQAVEHRPAWSQAHLRRGVACYHLSHYHEATEALSEARRLAQQAGEELSAAAADEHLQLVQAAHAAHVADCGGEVEAAVAQVKAQLHTSAKVK